MTRCKQGCVTLYLAYQVPFGHKTVMSRLGVAENFYSSLRIAINYDGRTTALCVDGDMQNDLQD